MFVYTSKGFPGGTVVKNPPANAGDTRDTGSIPGSGRFHGIENSQTLLKQLSTHTLIP